MKSFVNSRTMHMIYVLHLLSCSFSCFPDVSDFMFRASLVSVRQGSAMSGNILTQPDLNRANAKLDFKT